jgi:N-methylhydantoinase A
MSPHHLLGGKMRIHNDLALRSIAGLARRMGLTRLQAAAAVLRIVNSSMAKAISMVSVERGRDPRDFVLVAFGGAGPAHACDLAEELGVRETFVPAHAGLFSAYGLLVAELSRTFTMPVDGKGSSLPTRFAALERKASAEMKLDGFTRFALLRHVEARYEGQSHELTIPYSRARDLRKTFDRRHKELYGYSSADPVEVVNARLTAVVHRRNPGKLTAAGESLDLGDRMAWFGGRMRSARVHSRGRMRPGDHGAGPCVIEEYDSTIVVNPSWKWRVEEQGTRLSR